jgi:hypothetical protein
MMPPTGSAPTFSVPVREIVALEHPMIIKNIDNGLKTLGSGVPLQQVSIQYFLKVVCLHLVVTCYVS